MPEITAEEIAAMPHEPAGNDALLAIEEALDLLADALAAPSIRKSTTDA